MPLIVAKQHVNINNVQEKVIIKYLNCHAVSQENDV